MDGGDAVIRVVLVDDDPDFLLILRARLNLVPGIEVVGTATDGAAALDAVASRGPDAVVVDLLMPGIDGFATIEALDREHRGVGVVAYTAVTTTDARERVDRFGAELVQKTRAPTALVDAIRRSAHRPARATSDRRP